MDDDEKLHLDHIDLKNKNEMDEEFLNAKISSSMIYFSSILPKIESLSSIILQGDEDVLSMKKKLALAKFQNTSDHPHPQEQPNQYFAKVL